MFENVAASMPGGIEEISEVARTGLAGTRLVL
jgi:hypothetical protein